MSVVDHPTRRVAELNRRIAEEFGGCACWKASMLWDSYPVLEFGNRLKLIGKHGPVTMGDLRVMPDTEDWFVECTGKVVLTSDRDKFAMDAALDTLFVGRRLLRLEWDAYCSAVFSDGVVLHCRHSGEGDRVAEIRFPNGDCVDCHADGTIRTEATGQ